MSGHTFAALGEPHRLAAESPEVAALTYLDAIVTRNCGTLAQMTIDYPLRPISYRAGRHREKLGDLKLTRWTITGMRDEAPAISEVDVATAGILNDSPWSGTQVMRLVYNDEKFEARVRGAPDGRWTVMPNFLPTLWGTAVGSIKAATPSFRFGCLIGRVC